MLAYLRLMVQNRLAGFRPKNLRREGRGKARVAFSYLGFALLALYLYAIIVFLEMALFAAAERMGQPGLVIAVALLGCTLVTLLYSFFYVVSTLFFSKDNGFIAALPISSRSILTAKLATVVAGEIGLTFLVLAPLMIRYGVAVGADALFYVRALVGTVFVPMAPVAVSTLLSFLLIRVSALWKRRESMTVVMSFAMMIAVMMVSMNLGMSAGMNDGEITSVVVSVLLGNNSLTNLVLGAYPPLQWMNSALVGSGWAAWGNLLLFAAVSAAALALVTALFGGSYLRLALKQEETLRRMNAGKRRLGRERVRTPFAALYRQEIRDVLTVPVYATNCLTGVVIFPVMIVVMFVAMGNQLSGESMSMTLLGGLVPKDLYLAIATAALCFTTTMNMAVATAVSREGARHDLRKTYPVSGATHLLAKVAMGMTFNLVTIVFAAAALTFFLPAFWPLTALAVLLSQLFSLLWSILSLLVDVYHPRLNWKNETEAVKQNMNAVLGMLIGFALIALLVGAFLLAMRAGLTTLWALAMTMLLLALIDAAMVKWLFGKAASAYYVR